MTIYEVKDVLADLFDDAEAVMAELSEETGEFTLKQFLQTVTQRKQVAYIELLNRCRAHPTASPFNAAHQHFGNRLSHLAQQAGFKRVEDGYTEDIFGNPTKKIVYRRQK
jgi:hypothetical protein